MDAFDRYVGEDHEAVEARRQIDVDRWTEAATALLNEYDELERRVGAYARVIAENRSVYTRFATLDSVAERVRASIRVLSEPSNHAPPWVQVLGENLSDEVALFVVCASVCALEGRKANPGRSDAQLTRIQAMTAYSKYMEPRFREAGSEKEKEKEKEKEPPEDKSETGRDG